VKGRFLAMVVCAQLWALVATLPLTAAPSSGAQEATHEPAPLVSLPVLVLDRDLRPISDLTQSELELYEGKEEQSIESISRSPTSPAKIGFLVDTSASNAASLRALKLRDVTGMAREVLRAGDSAFVEVFARSGSLLSPLTSDFGRIDKALASAFNTQAGQGTTSLYDAIFWACSEELPTRSGRQALIVISDMLDNTSNHTREEVLAQAQPLGIAIYPVLLPEARRAGEGSLGGRIARIFADETGGFSFVARKAEDLRVVLRLIREDMDNTYFISYRPKLSGAASVKVQCTRKGVKVIAPDRRY